MKLLGRLRERVAHSSPALRSIVGLAAQCLPASVRYGPEFARTTDLIYHAENSPAWAANKQKELLGAVLKLAGETPAVQRDFRYDVLRRPDQKDIESVLRSLPVLKKENFREDPEAFLIKPLAAMDRVTTSGSSGEPAVFYLDKNRAASEWAYMCHSWSPSSYQPGDWRAMIRGSHLGGHPPRTSLVSRATSELMLSAMGLNQERARDFWSRITLKKIVYIHGYPSAISAIASAALESKAGHRFRVKGVFPVSEGMLPHQETLFATAFPNAKILPSYGLSERVAMARYEPSDKTYHFYPLYGYVEILNDEDKPVVLGQRGRVVATGLRLTGMPLVRYDTGDTAELVSHNHKGSPVVRDIKGRRAQEGLVTKNGGEISATALNLHTDAYKDVFAFRIKQHVPGKAEVLVVPIAGARDDAAEILAREFEKNSLGQIRFSGTSVDMLPATPNGKLRIIEQCIPQREDAAS